MSHRTLTTMTFEDDEYSSAYEKLAEKLEDEVESRVVNCVKGRGAGGTRILIVTFDFKNVYSGWSPGGIF